MNLILRNLCHLWASDGSHIGWRKGVEVHAKMIELFPNISWHTVKNKITRERESFESKSGNYFATRPDLVELM